MANVVLLSFDLEEFDLPLELGQKLDLEKQFDFSRKGLETILKILKEERISATFFVTGDFALRYPKLIKEISKKHEISSHSLSHLKKRYSAENAKKSKEIIERLIGKKIYGFRMPRLSRVDSRSLSNMGFRYDSSYSPTFLPGRYNNLSGKRGLFNRGKITIVPISVHKTFRLPFWIFFRLFGLNYIKSLTRSCIKDPGFVVLYFHPWEFNDLKNFNLPVYLMKKRSGAEMCKTLTAYIQWCKKNKYEFSTFYDFLKTFS
ncbi:hypothetical protein A3K73_01845 [Candidatus Pacearchaeota archaeon RBG_13_36_9]|nr:MAG: hypothetical protein A3K73_01845 [Candidatus Pacearchaeota archaeon RBG_13_36_9]